MKRLLLVLWVLAFLSGWIRVDAGSASPDSLIPPTLSQVQQRKRRPRRVAPLPPPESRPPVPPAAPTPAAPYIRVALVTDAPSAVITCDQDIVRIEEASQQAVRLGESEIHLAPVLSRKNPLRIYRVEVAEVQEGQRVDWLIRRLRSQFQQEVMLKADADAHGQIIYLGRFGSKQAARRFARQLKQAGYRRARAVDDIAKPTTLLAARSPADELLLRVPSQLTFAPLDESRAPLKFDGRAYRGRLVVRLNQHERLSIVNELPLEQYLWSVVPNELSPTAFPELEALKAQAIAARTFAVLQKLRAGPTGDFDVLTDARAQVYTGVEAEQPVSTRAVNETRGMIVTYHGEPIEAVYTSTCGGKTENAEFVFNESRPYLRSVRCAPEVKWLSSHTLITQRQSLLPQPVALLQVYGLLSSELPAGYLGSPVTAAEVQAWIAAAAALLHRSDPLPSLDREQRVQLGGFARALVDLFYPPETVAVLFTPGDIEYILDYADAGSLSAESRAAVALLLKDGVLSPSRLRQLDPQAALRRADAVALLARLLERAGALPLRAGTARWLPQQQLVIKPEEQEAQPAQLAEGAFLFKRIDQQKVPARRLIVVGGERVWFHTGTAGRVDYLELKPHPAGVAYDRASPVSHWDVSMTPAELTRRLRDQGIEVGQVLDVKVRQRGASSRVVRLEVVGTKGREELRRSAIRSALGLRETLFVIERRYDQQGRVVAFTFRGRGWGHGVGLCQFGADGLAREGLSAAEILKTYYTGVDVSRVY